MAWCLVKAQGQLHRLPSSRTEICSFIKNNQNQWSEHIEHMGKTRNAYRNTAGKIERVITT
jgi:hypothetical protein